MYGKIRSFQRDIGAGVIAAENGRSYRFRRGDIINTACELQGQEVDFLLQSLNPKDIIVLAGSPWSAFSAQECL